MIDERAELLSEMAEVARVRSLAVSGEARRVREHAGVGLRQLARAIDTSPTSLSRWETGECAPRHEAALRWAHALERLAHLDFDPVETHFIDAGAE